MRCGRRLWRAVACALALLAAGLRLAAAEEDSYDALAPSLKAAISEQVAAGLAVATAAPSPRWPLGFGQHRLERPIDSGYAWGADALICPKFLPQLYPEKNLGQLCGEDFYNSPWLAQRGIHNPFRIARNELRLLHDDAGERRDRLAWGAAYAYLHRECEDWLADTTLAMLADPKYLRNEVTADLAAPVVRSRLPDKLTRVQPREGMVAMDVSLSSHASYDSVASTEETLLQAARRGLQAVAVADRGRIDGAQEAQRIAERLKTEGKLPHDFVVVPGIITDTRSGAVLGLFVNDMIPEQMTMARAVGCIHQQGGLAYMMHPGDPGGPERLERMDFDGWLLQPTTFEMFRTLPLVNDPRLASKPALTASNSPYSGTAGLPYTSVEAAEVSAGALKQGLRERKLEASAALYFPWMTMLSLRPVAGVCGALNRYFAIHAFAEKHLARAIGADSVTMSTTWDDEVRSMIGLAGLPRGLRELATFDEPFHGGPRLGYIAADYSFLRIGYDRPTSQAFMQAVVTW